MSAIRSVISFIRRNPRSYAGAVLAVISIQSPEKHVPGSAHFRVVGDILVHQRQLDCALRPDGSYDFRPQFSQVRELLKGADYTIANLETTIGMVGGLPYSGYPRFNTPEALPDALRDVGVDFLSLANNHILDRGSEGMRKTADRVKAWGFDFDGVSLAPEERPVIVELGGIRVGLLSYTEIINIENSSETWPQAVKRGGRAWRENAAACKLQCGYRCI